MRGGHRSLAERMALRVVGDQCPVDHTTGPVAIAYCGMDLYNRLLAARRIKQSAWCALVAAAATVASPAEALAMQQMSTCASYVTAAATGRFDVLDTFDAGKVRMDASVVTRMTRWWSKRAADRWVPAHAWGDRDTHDADAVYLARALRASEASHGSSIVKVLLALCAADFDLHGGQRCQGPVGPQGVQGAIGIRGTTGIRGIPGLHGVPGYRAHKDSPEYGVQSDPGDSCTSTRKPLPARRGHRVESWRAVQPDRGSCESDKCCRRRRPHMEGIPIGSRS